MRSRRKGSANPPATRGDLLTTASSGSSRITSNRPPSCREFLCPHRLIVRRVYTNWSGSSRDSAETSKPDENGCPLHRGGIENHRESYCRAVGQEKMWQGTMP